MICLHKVVCQSLVWLRTAHGRGMVAGLPPTSDALQTCETELCNRAVTGAS